MSMWTGYNEFTVELGSGKEVTAEVECCVINDSNYGADADGNRGMSMTWIDSLELTVPISEWDKDDSGNELSQEEKAEAAEEALRDIALFLSCGGYNDIGLVEFDPAHYAKKIKETITQQLIQRRDSEDDFWSRYAPAEPVKETPIQ